MLLGAPLLFAFLPVDLIYAVAVDTLPPPALEAKRYDHLRLWFLIFSLIRVTPAD